MTFRTIAFLTLIFFSGSAFAQIEFGVKAGFATESLREMRLDFSRSGREDLAVAIADAEYGFQFGALLRIPLSDRFDIQTELTLNSAKTDFSFEDPDQNATVFLEERYNDINIPVMGSWKLAFVRFNIGPVGHIFVSSPSDLRDPDGRERTWDTFNLGYTIGGAVDVGNITIDIRYDGNFSQYGE